MRTTIRLISCTALTAILFGLLLGSVSAAAARPVVIEAPVILKINQYYVLYTAPDVPYIDSQNRFMLPLRAVGELLGASVSYDTYRRMALVAWDGNAVEVSPGSNEVLYNGKPVQLDTVPAIKQGQLFIPARVLLDGLHIQGSFKDSLLTLIDSRFKSSSKLIADLEMSGIDVRNTPRGVDIDTNDLRRLSMKLTLPASGGESKAVKLTVSAKNISGSNLPEGKEDLHPSIVTEGAYAFQDYNRARPAVKAGDTFEITWNGFDLSAGALNYILIVGETIG